MEYATREQAQNAVATLSNQNLMGRLVYVREVRQPAERSTYASANASCRTVRPSLDSLVPRVAAAVVASLAASAALAAPA